MGLNIAFGLRGRVVALYSEGGLKYFRRNLLKALNYPCLMRY